MKKRLVLWVVTAVMLTMAGCGQKKDPLENVVYEDSVVQENENAEEGTADAAAQTPEEDTADAAAQTPEEDTADAAAQTSEEESADAEGTADTADSEETAEGTYEDNFAVDTNTAADFGGTIKEAVAGKDIEKLADLTTFPVYVGLTEEGMVVETREDFIALGAEKLFTEEMVKSIAGADEKSLSPSMAGFTLYDGDDAPSITFGVQEGRLGISGINY